MNTYCIAVSLGLDAFANLIIQIAPTPERAALQALGLQLERNGTSDRLAAHVYWQAMGEPPSTVRLYVKASDAPAEESLNA